MRIVDFKSVIEIKNITYREPLPQNDHETQRCHYKKETDTQGSEMSLKLRRRSLTGSEAHEDGTDIVVDEVKKRSK